MKRYILFLVTILTTVGCIYANDTLQREVTIVRNFTPVLRSTEKINTLPPVTTPHFATTAVTYAFDAYSTEVNSEPSKVAEPYIDSKETLMKRYNGYATFDMGMYMAMAANVGYSILDTSCDKLGVSARFTSLDGDVPVNSQAMIIPEQETHQTFYDVAAGLQYAHIFNNNITLSMDAAFRYLNFNYYGVMGASLPLGAHSLQEVNACQAELRVDNSEAQHYDYERWHAIAGYSYYGNSSGLYTGSESSEHYAYVDGSYMLMLNDQWSVGGDARVNYLHYTGLLSSSTPLVDVLSGRVAPATESRNHFIMQLHPHALWSNDNMSLRLGAQVDFSGGDGYVIYVSPDIRYNWEFVNNYFLFATIDGGKHINSWNDMSQYCFYFDPSQPIASEFTALDAQLGFRMRVIPELFITLYGGYEIADRALFQQVDGLSQSLTWRTLAANCVKAGVRFDANITEYVTLSADATYRQWEHAGELISYNRPHWQANASLTVRPIDKLDIKLHYNMQLERDFAAYGKLADIHNLQLFATYRIFDWLSVSAHGNNLLNRRHDYYFGLPAPGIQVMGGVAVKF